jgi:hypothetical protein
VISHHNKIYKKPYKNQKKNKNKKPKKTQKRVYKVNSEKQKQKKYIYTLR